MADQKRARSVNFTTTEVHLLLELVQEYGKIVENKKTDGATNKQKDDAWEEISNKFNARSSVAIRPMKALRAKFDVLKKDARKNAAADRQQLYQTGGGKSAPSALTSADRLVMEITQSTMGGLPSMYDDDVVPVENESLIGEVFTITPNEDLNRTMQCSSIEDDLTESSLEAPQEPTQEASEVTPPADWSKWSKRMLQSKKRPTLQANRNMEAMSSAKKELADLHVLIAKNNLEMQEIEKAHLKRKILAEEEHLNRLRDFEARKAEEEYLLARSKRMSFEDSMRSNEDKF